ncbi:TPA: hypothetical protein JG825_003438 [Vibrio parahaemolyticus]|uniref:hypothetical protein n=1 Tax=Vibrio owensii TaxID=696485 RepID=UPI0018F19FFF|nr:MULTISPECIES: hypothetical protein [Vibrio harveyi group]UPR19099.1 hypothetical protein H9J99_25990 [Vibrio parahaemolyticus]HAV1520119.1 hypothetical protein [Vibrio parahaemolyticus]HAV1539086.1 hypothetical protein [Vibrio parahaemolyticus]
MHSLMVRVTAKTPELVIQHAKALLDSSISAIPEIDGRRFQYNSELKEAKLLLFLNRDNNEAEFAFAQGMEGVKLVYDAQTELFVWIERLLKLNVNSFSHVVDLTKATTQGAIETYHIKARFL